MNREAKHISIIYLITIGLLNLRVPLELLLNNCNFFSVTENELLAGIIIRPLLLTFLFLTIGKLGLKRFNGIGSWVSVRNLQALLIPLTIVAMGMMNNRNVYLDAELRILILFIISVLLLGLFEEFLFRGIILPLFIKAFGKHKHAIFLGVLSSALLFGITHYLNLIKEPDNFWAVTNQVFFATAMGVFFAGLLFRTRNIFVLAIYHALVNFSFGPNILEDPSVNQISDQMTVTFMNWPTILFFILIALGGVYMIKQTNPEEITSLLDEIRI